MQTTDQVVEEVMKPESWRRWAGQGGRVMLVLVLAWSFTRLVEWILPWLRRHAVKWMDRRHEGPTIALEKRARTLTSAVGKAVDTIIWLLAAVVALEELNFHVGPLLAGLGVASVALGFGAQTIIRDWLGGFFLLFEDQIRIGDTVVINGITGVVEAIDLRITQLRGENGALHVIANGTIDALSNLSREYTYYVFETTLAHGADADRALAILTAVGGELYLEEKYRAMILEPIEVMGVERLTDRGVVIKARIKTRPTMQAPVGREFNRRVRLQMEAAGITFPQFPPTPPTV